MNQGLYNSIEDLPMWNWNMVHEKNDYTYLRRHRINGKCSKHNYQLLYRTWQKIFDQYIATFGFDKNFLNILEKKKQIAFYQLEFINSGDEALQTIIDVMRIELEAMQPKENIKNQFWKTKATVERLVGFHIDAKVITVLEFHAYIENLKAEKKLA